MTPRRFAAWAFVALGPALASCSWARFNDVSEDAPVLVLTKPGGVGAGYGSSVAVSALDDEVRVLVGPVPGSSGAAEFELGPGQSPSKDSINNQHCLAADGCTMAAVPTGLTRAESGAGVYPLCFAEGLLIDQNKKPWVDIGCFDRIDGKTKLVKWPLPDTVSVTKPEDQRISTATERLADPASAQQQRLLVGLWAKQGPAGTAFVYRPGALTTPEVLDPGGVGSTYGSQVAMFAAQGATFFAIAEPDAGTIHFYRDDAGTATLTGCVQRAPGFGQTLAAGRVFPGADEDLVVADGKDVIVIPGGTLAALPSATCADVPEQVTKRLACRDTADVSNCAGGQFGAALAVADFDRDGDGEVVVGVPGMSVRDESSAGAVEVFDLEGDFELRVTDVKFISSAESGDRLGTSVAVAHQPDRDILVAGGPGGGKAVVFFCSKLLPPGKRGARCQ